MLGKALSFYSWIGIVSLFYVSACVEFIFACSFIAGNDLVKVVATSMLNRVPDLCRILVVSLQTEVYAFLLF